MTSVAIVIPTYERAQALAACLRSVAVQTYRVRQVVVIDNSCAASARTVVTALRPCLSTNGTDVTFEHNTSGNSGTEARNRGIRASKADVVLILDDDVVLDPSFVAEIVRVFDTDETAMGVQGVDSAAPSSALTNWLRKVFLDYHRTVDTCRVSCSLTGGYPQRLTRSIVAEWLPGFNQAFRRCVFEYELFDTRLSGYADGEDMDLSLRVARRWPGSLRITPAARLEHKKCEQARLGSQERILMQEVHELYLRHKLQRKSIAVRLASGWTRTGRLLVPCVSALARRNPAKLRECYYRVVAYAVCARHAHAIRNGELAAVLRRVGKGQS